MRTFVAIPLPAECRAMLEQMQRELRGSAADVGWVAIPSIHLTLKFLGEVGPEIIPKLAESLQTACEPELSFELCIGGLGCFPNLNNPRVIWCGIDGDLDPLARIHRTVENVCSDFGFAPGDRAFKPHLTLGRVKGKRNLQPLKDCIKIGSGLECSFRASHINIYSSTLKPKGAVYAILNTIMLRD
jgi:RNA 2',3'-cyclic 3'-phosphodiesterase